MIVRPNIKLRRGFHKGQNIIRIEFPYHIQITDILRSHTTATWSRTMGCWYIDEEDFDLPYFIKIFTKIAFVDTESLNNDLKNINKNMSVRKYPYRKLINLPKGYVELLEQKRYSKSTLSTYSAYFKDFIYYFNDRDLTTIQTEEINNYILSLIKVSNISGSEQNQRINAIKFYYEKILSREKQLIQIERP